VTVEPLRELGTILPPGATPVDAGSTARAGTAKISAMHKNNIKSLIFCVINLLSE
jgi:hypothetical protein